MAPASWILVIEDDREIAELITLYLAREQLEARVAPSAEAARDLLVGGVPALTLLDLNLPGTDGFQFLRELRLRSMVPVIIVSSRDSDEDKVAGLGLGADDFVTKPFSPRVLAAKVKALLRRASPTSGSARTLFGAFGLDFETRQLSRHGEPVELRRKEWELLAFLVTNPRKPYTAEVLYREIWGQDYGDLTTVAVHIQRLRRKLGEPPGLPKHIRTVPGFGYLFSPDGDP